MGKDIITYQRRLNLVDECLRKFGQPMNIMQIRDYCNKILKKEYCLRQYRVDIRTISDKYDQPLHEDKIGGFTCYTYADESFSIQDNLAVNATDLANFRHVKKALAELVGVSLDTSLTSITDEIDKFLGYDETKRPVISFEKVLLESHGKVKPADMLQPLLKNVIQHQTLDVKYEVPGRGKREWTIFPQFLKQYNQRWYLVATRHRDPVEGKVYNLALDRIVTMEANQHIPYKESGIDFDEYFYDVVGITKPEGAEPIDVVLRIERGEYPYIESKPIHPSQDELPESDEDKDYVYVTMHVYDNYELRSKILSYGSKVTVMEPKSLRDKIAHELSETIDNYKD